MRKEIRSTIHVKEKINMQTKTREINQIEIFKKIKITLQTSNSTSLAEGTIIM